MEEKESLLSIQMENQDAVPVPPQPQPRRRRPTPDHPPYSEMVQCAIRSLAEKQGSTESAISAYIEAHYPSLPWAHSRLLPYYLRRLLLAREISQSPTPNRYILPQPPGPNPSSPQKRGRPRKGPRRASPAEPVTFGPKRCRGRPRKYAIPDPEPERPRLILRLKRSKIIQIHPEGGVVGGCVWHCVKDCVGETESKGVGSCVHDEGFSSASGMKSDGEVSALRDENVKVAEMDEHYEELLALQENVLSGNRNRYHSDELSMLQEEDFNGVTIDGLSGVRSSLKEADVNGVEIAEHDRELVAWRENDLDGIRAADEHNGRELSVVRPGDLNTLRIMEHSGELIELQKNGLVNIARSDEHNEEFLALQAVPDAASCKKSGPDPVMLRKKAKPRKARRLWELRSNHFGSTLQLFVHHRYMHGAATSSEVGVYAYAAAQVKKAMEVPHYLGGENFIFWGGREMYQSLLNTDTTTTKPFISSIWGTFLIEPKPHKPTKHQNVP